MTRKAQLYQNLDKLNKKIQAFAKEKKEIQEMAIKSNQINTLIEEKLLKNKILKFNQTQLPADQQLLLTKIEKSDIGTKQAIVHIKEANNHTIQVQHIVNSLI